MNAVRQLRQAAGLTQAELAERSGVAQPNIAAYESGQRLPSSAMLSRLQRAARPKPSRILRQRRAEIADLARRHHARDVRVFGSVARRQDVSGSDLDLLVRFEECADLYDLAELTLALEELTGLRVDVVSEGGLHPGPNPIRDEAVPI